MINHLPSDAPQLIDARFRNIFKELVEAYLEKGQPVGSQTLAGQSATGYSSSTIRHVLGQLEHMGLVESPHISAGRLPTTKGLRLFIDGLMQAKIDLPTHEKQTLERSISGQDTAPVETLTRTARTVADLTKSAVMVYHRGESPQLYDVDLHRISGSQLLVVLVEPSGAIRNRVIPCDPAMSDAAFIEGRNFFRHALLQQRLASNDTRRATNTATDAIELNDLLTSTKLALENSRYALSTAASDLVERGIAVLVNDPHANKEMLVVLGQHNLLDDTKTVEQIERARSLFDLIDHQESLITML
nr:hypothetical protein [Alphaproteobacteria bacterium]